MNLKEVCEKMQDSHLSNHEIKKNDQDLENSKDSKLQEKEYVNRNSLGNEKIIKNMRISPHKIKKLSIKIPKNKDLEQKMKVRFRFSKIIVSSS